MAPRANWKGFLRLSLVTCPVALYPATSDSEKVTFNQINRNTGHRIKYARVDADTGGEVAAADIMKGFKVDTDTYIEVTKEELEKPARAICPNDRRKERTHVDMVYLALARPTCCARAAIRTSSKRNRDHDLPG
jgi:DNA end-binding protein Ku